MKKVMVTAILVSLCFLPFIAQAAKQNPQSMRDLIALGLETNLGLQIEMVNISQGTEAVEIEKSAFDSEIFAQAGYDRSSTPIDLSSSSLTASHSDQYSGQIGISKHFTTGLTTSLTLNSTRISDNDYSNNLETNYRTALRVDLNQPLLRDLGAAINTIPLEMARNRQRQASLTSLLQAQNLILQLEVAARQIAGETEITRLRQEALALAHDLYLDNRKRFAAGVIPISEVQEAETAQASRELSLSLSRQNRDLLLEELRRQLNYQLSDDFKPEIIVAYNQAVEEIKYPDLTQLFESAKLKRLELKIHDYTVKNSSLQQNYLRNQLKPQLDFNFQVGMNGLSGVERDTAAASQYSGSWLNSFGGMSDADGYHWEAGLKFSLPLGNRAAKSRYRQSELQLKQENYRQQDLAAALKNDLSQQQLNVTHALAQLRIAEHFSALAKTTLQQEQRRLEEGLSDTFRMISFQSNMIAAKIDRVNALTRYQLAIAQMEFARGNILERHGIILTDNNKELTLENI